MEWLCIHIQLTAFKMSSLSFWVVSFCMETMFMPLVGHLQFVDYNLLLDHWIYEFNIFLYSAVCWPLRCFEGWLICSCKIYIGYFCLLYQLVMNFYTNYLLRTVSLMENCACGLASFGNILNEQQRGLYVTSAAYRLVSCGLKFVWFDIQVLIHK